MMRRWLGCAALALLILLSVSGCGKAEQENYDQQAQFLVQGNLDLFYRGTADALYLAQVDMTRAQAQETFSNSLAMEADYFAAYFSLGALSAPLREEITELCRQIYTRVDYTVGTPEKVRADSYAVPVTVRPLDVMEQALGGADESLAAFREKYASQPVDNMTEDERTSYEAERAQAIITMVEAQLPRAGYKDAVELTLYLNCSNGVWQLESEGLQAVDALILLYP